MAREPSGRPQREKQLAQSVIRRVREIATIARREEWATELGRLRMNETITDAMYEAGKRWREYAETYRASIGVFPVRSTSLERGIRGHDPDPESAAAHRQAMRHANAAERFFEAEAVLINCGIGVENAVRGLCEDDRALVGMRELDLARRGLLAMATFWNLTNHKNSR